MYAEFRMDHGINAAMEDDGRWTSTDPSVRQMLNVAYTPERFSTEAGTPMTIAFYGAVRDWNGTVTKQPPEPKEPRDPGVQEDEETRNVFCPTGEGGGVDPSCGKSSPTGAAFTPEQTSSGLGKLKALPTAEEGYQTFDNAGDQIRMLDVGFAGIGKLYGNRDKEKEDKIAVKMTLSPDKVFYSQSSVIRDAVARKITGTDDKADTWGSGKDLPLVIKDGDNYYLQDGHHRSAAQVLARGAFEARVIEVIGKDRKGKSKYGKPTNAQERL